MIYLDQISIDHQNYPKDLKQQLKNTTPTSQIGNKIGKNNNNPIDGIVKNVFNKPIQIYRSKNKKTNKSLSDSSLSENSQYSSISSFSLGSIISHSKEKQNHEKNRIKILNFVLDSHPSKKDVLIKYQINGKQKTTSNKLLSQKLSKIVNQEQDYQQNNNKEESVNKIQSIQQDLKNELEIGLNRYYQRNCFDVCFRCKQVGHFQNQCTEKQVFRCNYCLSQKHQGDSCSNVSCFRCNRYGHRKYDCKIQLRLNFCPFCGNTSHKAEDCGMIVPVQTQGNNQIICLVCRQYGHANCNL
ncbi:unnamed protein product [Paramecium sonneborni]|uniref:CCHC-type domain-containing protein n=1 Tax=Paramecium sonneborni TaxID=65129 RepID=A0A8S1MHL9_9CILI|nr:unnamed protein product [Paramecium sonneborni]